MSDGNESIYLVRYVQTDQQNDHVIGIFTEYDDAYKSAERFPRMDSNWCHVQIEEIKINKYMDEKYESDGLLWEAYR